MFKTQYHYLVSSLPELAFDQSKLPFSLSDYSEELNRHLRKEDTDLFRFLLLPYDNYNLINILEKKEKPFNDLGNFSREYLEEAVKTQEKTPDPFIPSTMEAYIHKFIVHYKNSSPLHSHLNWENQLSYLYYDFVLNNTGNEFLINWLHFERNLTNMEVALNVRNHHLSMEKELVGDDVVVETLMSVKAKDFGMGQDYEYINTLINAYENTHLVERERLIDQLKWNKLQEFTSFYFFTVELALAYFIKLRILDRWAKLSKEEGRKVFNNIINKLQNSYEFPKEFVL